MRIRKMRLHGREVEVIDGVKWAETGERGVIIGNLFIVGQFEMTRAEASAQLGRRMRQLLLSREASTAPEALRQALADLPGSAKAYLGD